MTSYFFKTFFSSRFKHVMLVFVWKFSGCGFESCCSHLSFRYHACFEQEVPGQASIACRFILKRVCDTTRTYGTMLTLFFKCQCLQKPSLVGYEIIRSNLCKNLKVGLLLGLKQIYSFNKLWCLLVWKMSQENYTGPRNI